MVITKMEWEREDSAFMSGQAGEEERNDELCSTRNSSILLDSPALRCILTRRTRHSRTLTLLHDLKDLRRVRHVVLSETLDVDSSVLLLVNLKVVVVGWRR